MHGQYYQLLTTWGIYNRPWLTWIVAVAFYQCHKLAALLDTSYFRWRLIVHVPTEWEEMTTLVALRLRILCEMARKWLFFWAWRNTSFAPGQNFLWSLCFLFSLVWHMSKFTRIAWGKCYNQVCVMVPGQKLGGSKSTAGLHSWCSPAILM